MSKIEYFKNTLADRRNQLVAMIREIEDRLDDPKSKDVEDRATEREDDEVMQLQAKVEYEELKAVDAALARVRHDAYGICLICEEEISDERLNAVPHATLCRNCMGRTDR